MKPEEQKRKVEEILGSPLPELEKEYHEAAEKIFNSMVMNQFVTPYLLSELFTVQEMRMVLTMPATAEELAEKFSMNADEVREKMDGLVSMGRIISSRRPPFTYSPHMNAIAFRDSVGIGLNANGLDWKPYMKAIRLMELWVRMEYNEYAAAAVRHEMRVIPKYESIKNVPGVMYCENMKEIVEDAVREGKFVSSRCVCRSYASYLAKESFDSEHCNCLHEHGPEDGHCFSVSRQAEYFATQRGAYCPDETAARRLFAEAEASTAVYTTPNTRDTTFICSCCPDCCGLAEYEKEGFDVRKPSRFRPAVRAKRCIGCKKCESRCAYAAIRVEEGCAAVDEDKCMGCGNCVVTCPAKALKMKIVHEPEWVPDVPYVEGWYLPEKKEET